MKQSVDAKSFKDLSPQQFERLALDALRAHLGGKTPVRAFDTPYGVNDGGWDAEILGPFRGFPGPVAVEVKRSTNFSKTTSALNEYLQRPRNRDKDLLLVTAAELTRDQVTKLETGRRVQVITGGDLAGWLRDHPYIAGAHGLVGTTSWLEPVAALQLRLFAEARVRHHVGREGQLIPFESEQSTSDAAYAGLRGAGTATLLISNHPTTLQIVIANLVNRLASEGDQHSLVPIGIVEVPMADFAAQLRAATGALGAGRRFLLATDDTDSLKRMLAAVKDPTLDGWVIPTTPSRAEAVKLRLEHRGISVTVHRVLPPTRRELADWVAKQPGHEEASGLKASSAVLELVHPEIIRLWTQTGFDLPAIMAEVIDAPVLLALAASGLVDPLDVSGLAALSGALGGLQQSALDAAVADGLLQHDLRGWRPVGPALGQLGILACLAEGLFEPADAVVSALASLEPGREASAVEALARLGGDVAAQGSPAHLADVAVSGWSLERRRAVLRTHARVFCISERRLKWAIAEAAAPEWTGDLRFVAEALIEAVPSHPHLAVPASELVRMALGDQRLAPALAAKLIKPLQLPAWAARDVLQESQSWLAEDYVALAGGLRALVRPWLAADVAWTESSRAGLTFGARRWPVGNPDYEAAFQTAADLVVSMLAHDHIHVADAAWSLLPQLGRPSGPGASAAPENMATIFSGLLGQALRVSPAGASLAGRALREMSLLRCLFARWAKPHVADIVRAVDEDPVFLAFRAFTAAEVFVSDKSSLLAAATDPAGDPWNVLMEQTPGVTTDEIVDRLIATNAGTLELQQILEGASELERRLRELEDGQRAWGSPAVLATWAQRDPETFSPLVFTDAWRKLEPTARWRLVTSTAEAFAEHWAKVLRGDETPRLGVGAAAARFLKNPSRVDFDEARAMIRVLRATVGRSARMAAMHAIASHPDPRVRMEVWAWLGLAARSTPEPDPRDLDAVLRALLVAPHGLQVLRAAVHLPVTSSLHVTASSPREAICLDALEQHLEAASPPTPRDLYSLRPLLRRLLTERPTAWWRLAGAVQHDDKMLAELSDDDAVTALMLGPASPERLSSQARATDELVRRVSGDRFKAEVLSLVESEPDRAATWLRSRGMSEEALEATALLLPRLDREAREAVINDAATQSGAYGVWTSGLMVRDLLEEYEAGLRTESQVLQSYRARACSSDGLLRDGLLRDALQRMAALAEGR